MLLFDSSTHRKKWASFLNKHTVLAYKRGELILMQDEEPKNLYIIKSGVVRTYDIDSNGEEKTISFDNVKEIFPIGWAFEQIEKTQYFYRAFTDCEVYIVPREEFLKFLKLNPRMGYELYADVAGRFVNLQKRIRALEQSKAPDKIIHTISYLCERFGSRVSGETMIVNLQLTQQELSDFIGLTRETTSIELKKLEQEGLLSYQNKNYQVDLNKLDELLN